MLYTVWGGATSFFSFPKAVLQTATPNHTVTVTETVCCAIYIGWRLKPGTIRRPPFELLLACKLRSALAIVTSILRSLYLGTSLHMSWWILYTLHICILSSRSLTLPVDNVAYSGQMTSFRNRVKDIRIAHVRIQRALWPCDMCDRCI